MEKVSHGPIQKEKLQLAKRYLKGDYKVRVFDECISLV